MLQTETAIEVLRSHGLRLTPQRRAVLEALEGNTSHPLAEDVATRVAMRMPGVSLSTVYKTLHEFAALGLVRELDHPGAMRFDPETTDHAHLLCAECGTVVDLPLPDEFGRLVTAAAGSTVSRVEVTLYGTCPSCEGA